MFEKTTQVMMTLEARFGEGGFDPVGRSVAPIEGAVADAGGDAVAGVIWARPRRRRSVRSLLDRMATGAASARGRSPSAIADRRTGREIEVTPDETFALTPQIKGALKSLPGVVTVEEI